METRSSYSCYMFRKFFLMCWINKLCLALQVVDIADILVAEKIKYWQFVLCLHFAAIDMHFCFTFSMCITSKKSLVFKNRIGKRKKHGTQIKKVHFSNFIYVLFISCSLILCISCDFHIRVYLHVY
jgi:hypothetical protein